MYTTRRTFRQLVPAALCLFALAPVQAQSSDAAEYPGPLPTTAAQPGSPYPHTLAAYLNKASALDETAARPARTVPLHDYDPQQVDALQSRLDRELEAQLEERFR